MSAMALFNAEVGTWGDMGDGTYRNPFCLPTIPTRTVPA